MRVQKRMERKEQNVIVSHPSFLANLTQSRSRLSHESAGKSSFIAVSIRHSRTTRLSLLLLLLLRIRTPRTLALRTSAAVAVLGTGRAVVGASAAGLGGAAGGGGRGGDGGGAVRDQGKKEDTEMSGDRYMVDPSRDRKVPK